MIRQLFVTLLAISFFFLSFPLGVFAQSAYMEAQVTKVTDVKPKNNPEVEKVQNIEVKITNGSQKDKIFKAQNPIFKKTTSPQYRVGDRVIVNPLNQAGTLQIVDYVRGSPLIVLLFLFLFFVFAIGRWQGAASVVGLIYSFVIIIRFIVPNIVAGSSPVLIALLGALLIVPVTFFVSHGLSAKTTVAAIATTLSLLITAALAYAFIHFSHIIGVASEDAAFFQAAQGKSIDLAGLLLAGIIIGALGVLDDITVSQASVVERLRAANPNYSARQLYTQAIKVGRDHIASLVNTLILVYAGASLPLFLLFYDSKIPYHIALSQELIATEVIRTLVASIGIISAVPITTALAAYYIKQK